eukprot:PhF_6_TR6143/c0_g1_i2/m.9121
MPTVAPTSSTTLVHSIHSILCAVYRRDCFRAFALSFVSLGFLSLLSTILGIVNAMGFDVMWGVAVYLVFTVLGQTLSLWMRTKRFHVWTHNHHNDTNNPTVTLTVTETIHAIHSELKSGSGGGSGIVGDVLSLLPHSPQHFLYDCCGLVWSRRLRQDPEIVL